MSSASTPNLTGDVTPLRSAMKQDDDSERAPDSSAAPSIKAVQIAEPEPEPEPESPHKKRFSAGLAKRLSGRPPMQSVSSSKASLASQTSLEASGGHAGSQSAHQGPQDDSQPPHHRHRLDRVGERLVSQVAEWLEYERTKKQNRKSRRVHSTRRKSHKDEAEGSESQEGGRQRTYSLDSQSSDVSLDRLQKIIDDSMGSLGLSGIPHHPRFGRKSQRKRSVHLPRPASSDTEYHEGDVLVPGCDGMLDNSKAMSYAGGKATPTDESGANSSRKEAKERKAWITFKNEVIRLAHTLRLKGWRQVPLDSGEKIAIERLSGALTNAVYVVSPPEDMTGNTEGSRKNPPKLLLRVYGPQVEHIIDRDNELSVLRRLARKKIGPRLLGTFQNGRFEQFLNAETLTAEDLRDHDTSRQIAKRMRELHDGIELLQDEKEGGPAVWKNWDHWLDRVSRAITFLDGKILSGKVGPVKSAADAWKERGLICGTEWAAFKAMVDKYRQFVIDRYGGVNVIRDQLVFAHNDVKTQYGNILRVRPDDKKSPLMQPNYEHKQLVVIDFEYAAANVRGLEFANHFTEWCYDYTDEEASYVCNSSVYPTPEEQYRFIKAYVNHQPEYPHPGASTPNLTPLATPTLEPGTPGFSPNSAGSASSIVDFMLDARVPPGGWKEEERRQEEQVKNQVHALMEQTRLWRVANSAQWVAWGIMQAKIPGFGDNDGKKEAVESAHTTSLAAPPEEEEGDPHAFDYLGYAQERAMFFWGDCVSLGLVKVEDLPESMKGKLKVVDY
ncbi:Uu.00g116930.m01.CDS01 [Anthostomella pinea]|uniref:Uu.00g116930.m01.CDS01 n=1 Tax=Anthostomella pinea TaxID=933095 RepID=A0AAI8VH66_9PEZI|nr:Uu.00g116930.m01.CDS01 [Anthostomella pinea]